MGTGREEEEGGGQVNDIKPCVPSQPYLITLVCGINLGLERRKSLHGKGLY